MTDVWEQPFPVPISDATTDDGELFEDDSYRSDRLRFHKDAPESVKNWPKTGWVEIVRCER